MKKSKTISICKRMRAKLGNSIEARLNLGGNWMAKHVATCPRCQKRLGNMTRVEMAFTILRSQVHNIDLFAKANTQAVNTLKHSLRNAPAAEKLRRKEARPNWLVRNYRSVSSITSAAACLAILVLLKVGIFSSMDSMQKKGTESLKQYYAKQLDENTVNDIFTA